MELLRHLKVVGSTPTSGSIPVAALNFCQHTFLAGYLLISPPNPFSPAPHLTKQLALFDQHWLPAPPPYHFLPSSAT